MLQIHLTNTSKFLIAEKKCIRICRNLKECQNKSVKNIVLALKVLDIRSRDLNTCFTLNNCLFGSVKLNKNVSIYKKIQI